MVDDDPTLTDPGAATRRDRSATTRGTERYRLGPQLGRGGMGEVLSARDEQIGRDVAIKRIVVESPSARLIERFEREARIQGRLEHPAIVPVHEVGRDATGLPFFAMKKLSGTTLSTILGMEERPATWSRQRLLRAFVDVCLAIEFAHVHNVLHRDIKPANIMLGAYGEVYVLDWGVAKVIGDTDVGDDLRSDHGLTGDGGVVGTPTYMAPEQAAGEVLDERTDVYALGRVLDDILDGDSVPELATLCERAMAPERDGRVGTARELADGVQRYLDGDRDLALRAKLARDQLARAHASLAGGPDDGSRRTAMEAAGRALALDPTLVGASSLVATLLLEPPVTVPDAVTRALGDDARQWGRARARGAMRTHLAYLIVAATVISTGALGYLPVLAAVVAVVFAIDVQIIRGRWRAPSWLLMAMIAPAILLVSHLYSPVLVAPTFAAIVAVNLSLDPSLSTRWGVIGLVGGLAVSVLGPLALEHVGALQRTVDAVQGGLLLHAPGLFAGQSQIVILAVYVVAILAVAASIGRAIRANDLAMRTRLHTIAWRLQQLLPDGYSTPTESPNTSVVT